MMILKSGQSLFPAASSVRYQRWFRTLAKTTLTTTACLQQFPLGADAWLSRSLVTSYRQSMVKHPLLRHHFSMLSALTQTQDEEKMTRDALLIVDSAIEAVSPYTAVKSHFQYNSQDNTLSIGAETTLPVDKYQEIVLVAFGKASSAMATAVVEQLKDASNLPKLSGLVICKDDHATTAEQETLQALKIPIHFASHPVPDARSADAAQQILDLVKKKASATTLVICCISGGGSSLFCRPRDPLTLKDLQATNSLLLASGMGIQEINVIRKRLEEGKGGRLAVAGYPSTVATLVLSDVLGDPLDLIASGPTVPDTSTWQDAWRLVQQYDIQDDLSPMVLVMLQEGMDGILEDSPPPDHPVFAESPIVLVGNNNIAVEAAAEKAKDLGYYPMILGTHVEGEAKEIAHIYTAMALYLQQQAQREKPSPYAMAPSLPVALIAGGETTVSLGSSTGKGGRNQELALSAALQLESLGLRNVVLASVGTDGTDGPTDAAGAVVDGTTVTRDLAAAQEALDQHNAYPLLKEWTKDGQGAPLIKTGPTGTNVADVCVTLISKARE